jgi:hypothetical protein
MSIVIYCVKVHNTEQNETILHFHEEDVSDFIGQLKGMGFSAEMSYELSAIHCQCLNHRGSSNRSVQRRIRLI